MVCSRCIMVVDQVFRQAGITPATVILGEVKLSKEELSPQALEKVNALLSSHGFEIIDDKKSRLLEQIKAIVIEKIHHQENYQLHINWSNYLAEKLSYEYHYLSSLFSSVTGVTLEQYIIKQKVEKIKEYLFYDELSVKEISYRMGYSSVAHLSSQFKKITGLTPTEFKEARQLDSRRALDNII